MSQHDSHFIAFLCSNMPFLTNNRAFLITLITQLKETNERLKLRQHEMFQDKICTPSIIVRCVKN